MTACYSVAATGCQWSAACSRRRQPHGEDYGCLMDRLAEQAALLALLHDRRSGWGAVAEDVEGCGSAIKVLRAEVEHAGQVDLLAPDPDEQTQSRLDAARAALQRWTELGLNLVTLLDAEYPSQLMTVHQRPPFLFYRGHLEERDARGVAIVGTRKPSVAGASRASTIAAGLAERGVTVISGLASGIDTAAHRGALEAGGRTVAVIGTGLRRHYPTENRELQERLAADHLVLSQFWPDAAPTKTSFPMRNAVMSGYAAATVVVEAAWKSGARMQARLALEHGRPVFLLDSLLQHDWAQEYARRPGAEVVHDADDVLARLDALTAPSPGLSWQ